MRTLLDTPERAVEGNNTVYGLFKAPFREINLLDANVFKQGERAPRWVRRFRLKEWEHVGIFHEDFFLGVALVDIKLAGLTWCCVFDRISMTFQERQRKLLPGKVRIPPDLQDGGVDLKADRGYRIVLENRLREGRHRLVVEVKAKRDFPGVFADVTLWEKPDQVQPIIALLPIEEQRPFFSHKAPSFVEGEIRIGERSYTVKPHDAIALMDFHRAFYPHRTFWEWATFAGLDRNGDLIGVNLTRNVIQRDDLYNENALWVRNTLHPLGPADFRIPEDREGLWHIRTRDGLVDLSFKPMGVRNETIRIGPFLSHYVQPVGLFSGKLSDGTGRIHTVEDLFGVAEDHRVTW